MVDREGDALSQFLAFMQPFKPVAYVEATEPDWDPPDGDEPLLLTGPRSVASLFGGGTAITGGDDLVFAAPSRRMLPSAA